MSTLIVPDTGVQLVDGSIVILARFPSTKWVVHHGWYTYGGQQMMGWYFCSIPANTVIPASDSDLRLLTVVSNSGSCECPSTPTPVVPAPPAPPGPGSHPGGSIEGQQAWELDRAFISVNTIAERNLLNKRLLPDGKLVRVGNDGDGPEYYRWNQVTGEWEIEHFGVDTEKFLTTEQAEEVFLKKSDAITQEDLDKLSKEVASVQSQFDGVLEDVAEAVSKANEAKDLAKDAQSTASGAQTTADEAKAQVQDAISQAQSASQAAEAATALANEARESASQNATNIQIANDRIDAVASEVADIAESVERVQDDLETVKGQVSDIESDLQEKVDDALKTSQVLTDAVDDAVSEAVSAEVADIHQQLDDINAQIVEIRESVVVQDEWGALPAV